MVEAAPNPVRGRRTAIVLLAVITVSLVVWALKMTYVVTMPLMLAFFVAFTASILRRR